MKNYKCVGNNPRNASGKSSKFWGIELSETTVTTRWGKLNGNIVDTPQESKVTYSTIEEAKLAIKSKTAQKLKEGYKPTGKIRFLNRPQPRTDSSSYSYRFVKTADEIRSQIRQLNLALKKNDPKGIMSQHRLSSSRYWVFDSQKRTFGLSKMVAYYPIDPAKYAQGLSNGPGPWMNGGPAHIQIEALTKSKFERSDPLLELFRLWVQDKLAVYAERSLKFDELKFLIV